MGHWHWLVYRLLKGKAIFTLFSNYTYKNLAYRKTNISITWFSSHVVSRPAGNYDPRTNMKLPSIAQTEIKRKFESKKKKWRKEVEGQNNNPKVKQNCLSNMFTCLKIHRQAQVITCLSIYYFHAQKRQNYTLIWELMCTQKHMHTHQSRDYQPYLSEKPSFTSLNTELQLKPNCLGKSSSTTVKNLKAFLFII